MKTLTRKQLEAREARAVPPVREVSGDNDKGDDIEHESLGDSTEHLEFENDDYLKYQPHKENLSKANCARKFRPHRHLDNKMHIMLVAAAY